MSSQAVSKGISRPTRKRKATKEEETTSDGSTTAAASPAKEPISSFLLDKTWMESNCHLILSRTFNPDRKQTSEQWLVELKVTDEIRDPDEWRDQKVDFDKDLVTFKQFHDLFNGSNSRYCQRFVFYDDLCATAVVATVYEKKPVHDHKAKEKENTNKKQKTEGSAGAGAGAGSGATGTNLCPEYCIVNENGLEKLSRRVTELMFLEWKPKGGVTVVAHGGVYEFLQSMVRGL